MGNGTFRAHQHQDLKAGIVLQLFGKENHGWDTHAAADGNDLRPCRIGRETVADRPEYADVFAADALSQNFQSAANGLVEELEPTLRGVGPHDRQGSAHGNRLVAGKVGETARDGAGSASGRPHAQNELIPRKPFLREDFGVLQADRAACLGMCHDGSLIHCSAMTQAAWLSMSPFLTRRFMRPDALASRSRDSAARELNSSSVVTTGSP